MILGINKINFEKNKSLEEKFKRDKKNLEYHDQSLKSQILEKELGLSVVVGGKMLYGDLEFWAFHHSPFTQKIIGIIKESHKRG